MELRHLRSFVAVAEELHFGKAARRLRIAQPPLSQQIRRLEAELGTELFFRTRRSVQLTDAGSVLLDHARRLLASAEEATSATQRAARGEVGRLAVGLIGSVTYQDVVPGILRRFRQRHPDVELALSEYRTVEQLEALRDGRIQVGFLRAPVADTSLEIEPVFEEELLVALPKDHALTNRIEVPLRALANEPFVLVPRSALSFYDQVIALCREAGFTPILAQEAREMTTIVGLVAAGLGVSLVPASVKSFRRAGVVYRPLRGVSPVLKVGVAYRGQDASPVLRAFVALVRAARLSAGRRSRDP